MMTTMFECIPSWNSIKNSVLINSVLGTIGYLKYKVCSTYNNVGVFFGMEVISSVLLLAFMRPNNPYINDRNGNKKDMAIIIPYFLTSAMVKSLTHYCLLGYIDMTGNHSVFGFSVGFLLRSFLVEVIFDGVHYGMHRLMHENMFMYRHLHKLHHRHQHPSAISTFVIHPGDLCLAYSIPLTVSMYFVRCSQFEFSLISVYLTYQEIAGHLGKRMYPTSSFCQCIWLPRMLGMELYTEDHNLHHTDFVYNYSKRFSLWDKVFGTYKKSNHLKCINKT